MGAQRGTSAQEDAVLILGCRNEACRSDAPIDARHDAYGWREWTAPFTHDGTRYVPRREEDLQCPDCDRTGSLYAY